MQQIHVSCTKCKAGVHCTQHAEDEMVDDVATRRFSQGSGKAQPNFNDEGGKAEVCCKQHARRR